MADITEVIKKVIIESQTRGLDQTVAGMQKFAATGKDVAQAADAVSSSTTKMENSLGSSTRTIERALGKADPLRKELKDLARDLADIEKTRGDIRFGFSDADINRLKQGRIEATSLAKELAQQATVRQADIQQGQAEEAKRVTQALKEQQQAYVSLQQSAASLKAQLDPLAAAQAKHAASVEQYRTMLSQGLITQKEFAQAVQQSEVRIQQTATHMLGTAAAGQKMGEAAKLSAYEMRNLGFQLNDAATMLLSGSSVFQVAATQGGQTLQVLQGGGGLVANIKDLGSRLLGLVTPANVAFGAIAAGAVATALAVNKVMDATREARIATTSGRGRLSGLNADDVDAMAARTRAPGVSSDEAREGVLAGVRTGTSARAIEQANAIAKQYATTLQMELLPAQKELMAAFANPAKGAEELNQKFEFLTTAQIRYIQQLQATKGPAEAAVALQKELVKALVDQKDASTGSERVLADLKTAWDQVADAVGKATIEWLKWQRLQAQTVGRGIEAAGEFAFGGSVPPFRGGPPPTIRGETPRQAIGPLADTSGVVEQSEGTRVAAAEAEKLAKANAAIAASVATLNTAFANQVAVMNATTVESRALATAQQVLNDLSEKGALTEKEYAQAALAGQLIREQAAATSRQRVADQQIEIEINSRMISAYQQQGDGIESVVARLKEEQSIRQAGMDATSKENQARIENAGLIAEQTKALEKLKSAQQGAMATTYNPNAAGGYEMANPSAGEDRTSRYNDKLQRGQLLLERMNGAAKYVGDSFDVLGSASSGTANSVQKLSSAASEAADKQYQESEARAKAFQAQKFVSTIDVGQGTAIEENMDRAYGKGVWKASGYVGVGSFQGEAKELQQKLIEDAQKSSHQIATQALQSSISIATRALSKQIQQIQEAASDQLEVLRDAAQEAGDALSKAADKRQELETKLKEQEDKRQQRIQNYLAAGPSPFEKNADIFYDPKSRMAFAEQIAGNTDELLVAQLAAAKAQEDAAKDADKNAKAAVKAGEATQKAAEEQVKQLQAQQEQLEMQAELISAGLDIDSGISNNVLALIGVIKSELPGAIGDHMSALLGITGAKAQTDLSTALKDAPLSARYTATGGATGAIVGGVTALGGAPSIGGGGVSLPGYGVGGTSLGIRGYARGGEFTVPGSYSAGDRPFVVGLAGQERVTVETPGQQASRRGGGGSGTQIENLIVQMPPATNPIEYLNKRSRPALSRAVRGMARGMH